MFLVRQRMVCSSLNATLKQVDTVPATTTCCVPVLTTSRQHHVLTSPPAITTCRCPQENYSSRNTSSRSSRYRWSYSTPRNFSVSRASRGVAGPSISSRLAADRLIRDMSEDERAHLEQALRGLQEELHLESDAVDDPPTSRQLLLTGVSNALPFIGFGFLDNAVMIVAGEYIDITIGQAFGISTMAAAALGNMISDMAGIGLAGYVEVLASRLGIEEPHLTGQQLMMKSTRFANYGGRALGIMFGCFLGMFPLLFFDGREEEDKPAEKTE